MKDTPDLFQSLVNLYHRCQYLGIKKDLSRHPEFFNRNLEIKGLFIWGRAKTELSLLFSQLLFDVIIYNETNPDHVETPKNYFLFRLYDLQEFPYLAAVRIHSFKPKK